MAEADGPLAGGSLRTRLTRSFALVALSALVAAAAVVGSVALLLAARAEYKRAALVLEAALRQERRAVDLETGLRGYELTGDPAFLEPYRRARGLIDAGADQLDELIKVPAQRERAALIRARLGRWMREYADPLIKAGPARGSLALERRGKAAFDEVRAAFDVFTTAEKGIAEARDARFRAAALRLEVVGALALLAFLALLGATARATVRAVADPVAALTAATSMIAAGDYAMRVPPARHEPGRLAERFNQMAARLGALTDELRAERDAARERAAVLAATFEASADGLAFVDPSGTTRYANRAFAGMFGLEPSELVGTDSALRAVGSTIADPPAFAAVLEGLCAEPDRTLETEVEVVRPVPRTVRLHTAPVMDNGARVGRVWASRDVTAERGAARAKDDLLASVSHEMRTPLSALMGFTELMLSRNISPERARGYLETMQRESRRLADLVNDFLDVQRWRAGRVDLRRTRFDLVPVAREVARLLEGMSERHRVRVEAPHHVVLVDGDEGRIAQVLKNLISNAIKYSPDGGEVLVEVDSRAGETEMRISDRGVGFGPDVAARLFDEFYRAPGTDAGGTGLGLAIVKRIVEAHGGRIEARGNPGAGATFAFTLPAHGASTLALPPAAIDGQPIALIVEDDPAVAELLVGEAEHAGYAAFGVATGEAALRAVREVPVALVLLDVRLAGEMDGWEVLRRLREAPETQDLPVVLSTVVNDQARGTLLGVSEYLLKPYGLDTLGTALRRYLPSPNGGTLLVAGAALEPLANGLEAGGYRVAAAGGVASALEAAARLDLTAVVSALELHDGDGLTLVRCLRELPGRSALPAVVVSADPPDPAQRLAYSELEVELIHGNGEPLARVLQGLARATAGAP